MPATKPCLTSYQIEKEPRCSSYRPPGTAFSCRDYPPPPDLQISPSNKHHTKDQNRVGLKSKSQWPLSVGHAVHAITAAADFEIPGSFYLLENHHHHFDNQYYDYRPPAGTHSVRCSEVLVPPRG